MKYVNVEDLRYEELAESYADWNDLMDNSFNGTPLPKQFPRVEMRSYKHKGEHMTFPEFERYFQEKTNE